MSGQPVYIPERNVDVIEPGLRARKGRLALNLVRDITFKTDALRSYAFARWEDVTCDALVLAGAVEYIDHLVKRPETGWTRRLTVRVPVHDPARWRAPKVSEALHEALCRLTGDIWQIEFVKRRSPSPRPPQEYLNLSVPTKAVLAYAMGWIRARLQAS